MKKMLLIVLSTFIAIGVAPMARADVNDFKITDYKIDYQLGRDESNRSTLKTVERITAFFPDSDQNHGIERALADSYDGHSTSLKIESVVDGAGMSLSYSTYENSGNTVLRIGDADTYVHGQKTYVLTYTQRDVTRYFPDNGRDEFYWDTNGTGWKVPIGNLSVSLNVDRDVDAVTLGNSCYVGAARSSDECLLTHAGNTYTVIHGRLAPGENVTIAVGFQPETFAAYEPTLWEKIFGFWLMSLVVTGAISVAVLVWLIVRYVRTRNRLNEVSTIVPEYVPPKGASVTAAAEVIDAPRSTMTAQILDLAVRHYLRIYEMKPKSTFKKAEYDLQIIKKIDKLNWEEQELIRDLFDGSVNVGARMSMKTLQSSTAFYNRIQNNAPGLKKRVRGEYALREKHPQSNSWFKRTGYILLIVAIVTLSPFVFGTALLSFIFSAVLWRLSDRGLELRRYLLGLKDYITVAETERIKMLQSPEGAAKIGEPVDVANQSQIIKLYERVLPYAVLFGQEKDWSKQLGDYYEGAKSQPDWYRGASGFHAVNFASAMSSFSSSSSYMSPSSSSSGGSGGGGFSGGGGGGGGGGGW